MSGCSPSLVFFSDIYSNLKRTSNQDSSSYCLPCLKLLSLQVNTFIFGQVRNMHMVERNRLWSRETGVLFADATSPPYTSRLA